MPQQRSLDQPLDLEMEQPAEFHLLLPLCSSLSYLVPSQPLALLPVLLSFHTLPPYLVLCLLAWTERFTKSTSDHQVPTPADKMATKVISHIQFLKIHSNFFSKSRNAFKILNLNLKTSLCCSADLSSSTSSSEQISHKKDVELISGQLAAEFSVSGSSLQQLTEEADVAKEKHSFPTKYIGIELPVAHDSRVKSAAFFKSSVDVTQCPTDGRPEIAVIGRSNVGKSSLINMLVNRKELALTSKKPGNPTLLPYHILRI